ncbi:hypothetical protein V8E53_009537, partial [Lactarius tabidus]
MIAVLFSCAILYSIVFTKLASIITSDSLFMLSNMAATAVSGPGPRQCACPRCAQIPTPTRAARRAGVSQGPRVRRYALARQIVEFDMRVIRGEEDTAVYGQPFMLLGDALES